MATQFDPIAKDESLNTTEATPRNIADVIAEGLKGIEDALPTYTEGDGIDISSQKEISVDTTFTEASTRANIASGDSLSTIWGKIKKFFTDLKAVAFSGAAADVTYGSGSVKDALDALKTVKVTSIPQAAINVTANTAVSTTLNFGSLDTSKILMVQVVWSNTASDQPTYIAYYKGSSTNYINTVQHRWSVTQTVRFTLLVLYAE